MLKNSLYDTICIFFLMIWMILILESMHLMTVFLMRKYFFASYAFEVHHEGHIETYLWTSCWKCQYSQCEFHKLAIHTSHWTFLPKKYACFTWLLFVGTSKNYFIDIVSCNSSGYFFFLYFNAKQKRCWMKSWFDCWNIVPLALKL